MTKKRRIMGVVLFVFAALGITTWLAKRKKAHEEIVGAA